MPVTTLTTTPVTILTTTLPARPTGAQRTTRESGSQTTEYALIMVVAATIAALALAWARNGAVADLLTGVLDHVRSLFGME